MQGVRGCRLTGQGARERPGPGDKGSRARAVLRDFAVVPYFEEQKERSPAQEKGLIHQVQVLYILGVHFLGVFKFFMG